MSGGTDRGAPLLEVEQLRVRLALADGPVDVVDGVSFSLRRGETLALVGESGSGKSLTAAALLRLVPAPGEIAGGRVRLEGDELLALPERAMQRVRGGRIALIPQDALAALNPVQSIGAQLVEALQLHHAGPQRFDRRAAWERAVELLAQVGIPQPALRAADPPHRLSGGQRQRVLVAMALAGEPALLVADEPTTALDVSSQAQVLRLLESLQRRHGLALLLITHDLGVVARLAHRVAVMYAGRIVEMAQTADLLAAPRHPYAAGLLGSVAIDGLRPGSRLPEIAGQVPSLPALQALRGGCAFAPRCRRADERCQRQRPPSPAEPDDAVACWHPLQGASVPVAA